MSASHSVTTWIGKLKNGEPEAAQQLWERYFQRLVFVARDQLRGLSRAASDEEDVALSAFHSFCQAVGRQRYPQLNNRDDLWRVLVTHTARKAVSQRRYQETLKRGGSGASEREIPLEEVIGDEPDPQFVAMVADEFHQFLKILDDDSLRTVALLKLEGHTNSEIAQRLGISVRSVARKLTVIRSVWQEQ